MICRALCLTNAAMRADFSFSGLKTALRQLAQNNVSVADASASFQAAVIDILCDRSRIAIAMFRRDFPGTLVVAGGVAANQAIGAALARLCQEENFIIRIPPPQALHRQCGDDRLGGGGTVVGRRRGRCACRHHREPGGRSPERG